MLLQFLARSAGEKETYTYRVPSNHMPGLFW